MLDFLSPFKNVRLGDLITLLNEHKINFKLVDDSNQPMLQLENSVYMDFIAAAPEFDNRNGFFWGDGSGQQKEGSEKKLTEMEDMLLYTIGVS